MRYFGCCLLVCALGVACRAEGPSLADARQRWLRGNYEEARQQYETLGREARHKAAAAIGISRTWQGEGKYDLALEVIDQAIAATPDHADLLARRAEVLHLTGQWPAAEQAAASAIKIKKDHYLARWVQAQVLRDRGEVKKADSEFRWFVRTYNEMEIKDPDLLLLVGQAGAENARWHNLADQFQDIINDIYADALKADKDLWQAEHLIGLLLLEKYNRGQALEAFDNALKINPRAAEALVGKGQAALQKYEIKDAEQFAERALKINPNLPDALRLRADIHLLAGDLKAAEKELALARKVNPRDETTLGRVAACLHLRKRKAEFEAIVKEVEVHDPKPGLFFHELAERLEERRQFDAAEEYYKKAIEARPMLPWPRGSLGMLYLRMGREKEAREILTKAFDADQFNVRVSNSLKVLRHLASYETIKTAHFELRFDPKLDQVLGKYLAQYLEETYDELARKFDYRPQGPILFEVFNNHDMFSGRTVGVPDLHTIGACTGRIVAMVSPRGKGVGKPFNWSRVVRHELVHIFNLEQTAFQCPHWFTEGLAVIQEQMPRPQQWNQILLRRVPEDDLLNLDTIDLGFIRPRSPEEWHLAYCQSQLYVEYMQEKYGAATVGEMLKAYRDGLDTTAAIQRVCKVDKASFEKGYLEHVRKVAATLKGKPVEKTMTFTQLKDAQEKDPENPDLAARLAEQYLLRRRNTEARKLAEKALEKVKGHPLASYVKARLLLSAGDEEDARAVLEAAVDIKTPDTKVLQALAHLYFEAKDLKKAADMLELARRVEPYESRWLLELARVYGQSEDKDKLIKVLKDLVPTDADELGLRKKLAQMLLDANRLAEAEQYAREALEIDVLDSDAQEVLLKALAGQKKEAEANRFRKLFGRMKAEG